jgi:hypothetical protein
LASLLVRHAFYDAYPEANILIDPMPHKQATEAAHLDTATDSTIGTHRGRMPTALVKKLAAPFLRVQIVGSVKCRIF